MVALERKRAAGAVDQLRAWGRVQIAKLELLAEAPAAEVGLCLLYTSPSPRDRTRSRMPSSA